MRIIRQTLLTLAFLAPLLAYCASAAANTVTLGVTTQKQDFPATQVVGAYLFTFTAADGTVTPFSRPDLTNLSFTVPAGSYSSVTLCLTDGAGVCLPGTTPARSGTFTLGAGQTVTLDIPVGSITVTGQ